MNKALIKQALNESLAVMESEKRNWGNTCDLYDTPIESCKTALKELNKKVG